MTWPGIEPRSPRPLANTPPKCLGKNKKNNDSTETVLVCWQFMPDKKTANDKTSLYRFG